MGTLGGERAEGVPAFVDALLPFAAPPEDPALSALLTIGLAAPTQRRPLPRRSACRRRSVQRLRSIPKGMRRRRPMWPRCST